MKSQNPILAYIEKHPKNIQSKLMQIRAIVLENAPNAEECISYGMPAFKQGKMILYFAAFKNHIGIYPTANGVVAFEKWSKKFKTSKGAIQIPNEKDIPVLLLKKLVLYRISHLEPKTKKTHCSKGHVFEKKGDGNTCPICAKELKNHFFIPNLSAPAVRALQANKINSLKDFSKVKLVQLSQWHGIGPKSLSQIALTMKNAGLKFKE